jgi:hypothetical protein
VVLRRFASNSARSRGLLCVCVGAIEQVTGNAKNGLVWLAVALIVGAVASLRLRHGNESLAAPLGASSRGPLLNAENDAR